MIYTVTLNPALDDFLDVQDLWVHDANRVTSECLYAGGKGIDVSRAIRRLGSDSMALGFIGGHNGQIMLDLLKKEGVTCYFTSISQETPRNIIIGALSRGTQTMLNARGDGHKGRVEGVPDPFAFTRSAGFLRGSQWQLATGCSDRRLSADYRSRSEPG